MDVTAVIWSAGKADTMSHPDEWQASQEATSDLHNGMFDPIQSAPTLFHERWDRVYSSGSFSGEDYDQVKTERFDPESFGQDSLSGSPAIAVKDVALVVGLGIAGAIGLSLLF